MEIQKQAYSLQSDPQRWIEENTIYKVISGSHAYGLNHKDSDLDIRGVAIPPLTFILGLRNFEQYIETKERDLQIYDIKKFFKLAGDSNPNVLELLYIDDPELILVEHPVWKKIKEKRHLFLSQRVKFTYSGYAFSQLKRIKSHRNYLFHPMKKKPERSDYNLPDNAKMPSELLGAIRSLEEREESDEIFEALPSVIMGLYQKERSYQNALKQWKQYQTWLKNRSPERAELERRYSFDTKHASHVFRLLIQGKELLKTGHLYVKLSGKNMDIVKDVKAGKLLYEDMLKIATEYIDEIENMPEAKMCLPRKTDIYELDMLYMNCIEQFHYI